MVIYMESKYLLATTITIAAVSIFAIGIANAHATNDIDWMKDEMKEHMNLTDEEVDEMTEHCPMMRGR